jgi:mannose/fructose/N-acetylgalactosamine-specific phosphotransferase system component IID
MKRLEFKVRKKSGRVKRLEVLFFQFINLKNVYTKQENQSQIKRKANFYNTKKGNQKCTLISKHTAQTSKSSKVRIDQEGR